MTLTFSREMILLFAGIGCLIMLFGLNLKSSLDCVAAVLYGILKTIRNKIFIKTILFCAGSNCLCFYFEPNLMQNFTNHTASIGSICFCLFNIISFMAFGCSIILSNED